MMIQKYARVTVEKDILKESEWIREYIRDAAKASKLCEH